MSVFGIRLAGLLLLWMAVASVAARPMARDDLKKHDDMVMKKNIEEMKKGAEIEERMRAMDSELLLKHVSAIPPFITVWSDKHLDTYKSIFEKFDLDHDARTTNNFVRVSMDTYKKEDMYTVVSKSSIESSSEDFSAAIRFRLSGTSVHDVGVIFGWTFDTRYAKGVTHDHDIEDFYTENENPDTLQLLFASTKNPPLFEGFAVVIDTSKNRHVQLKDVSLVYNDGTMSTEEMYRTATGCAANFHYWEKRDDVKIDSASQLRLGYSKGRVTLHIDRFNTGTWTLCGNLYPKHLKNDFAKHAHVGVTGIHRRNEGTSNLDVMEMHVYDSAVPPKTMEESRLSEKDPYGALVNHMEFEATRMYALFRTSILHMSELAQNNTKHMDSIEGQFKDIVLRDLGHRISEVEEKLHKDMDNTVTEQVADVERYLVKTVEDTLHELYSSAQYYFIPLVGIVVVFVAVYLFSYVKYRELKKAHLC